MEPAAGIALLPLAVLAAAGAWLWRRLAGGLVRLPRDSTALHGWLAALIAWTAAELVGALALVTLHGSSGDSPPSLATLMSIKAAAMGASVVVLLAWVRARHGSLSSFGLSPRPGPPAALVGLSAWLVVFPGVLGIGWFNQWLLGELGLQTGLQEALLRFLGEPESRRSLPGWLSMAVVLPVCEEVLFRGGLHGSLRRVLPVPVAIALSGTLFGLAHDPQAALPAAALGVALGWLYERSGRLSVPIAFHVLHNGLTLAMVAALPMPASPA